MHIKQVKKVFFSTVALKGCIKVTNGQGDDYKTVRLPYWLQLVSFLKNSNLSKNILLDEKTCEDILVYEIPYKTLIAKLLHISFDKVDGFIRVYDGTRCLILCGL